MTAINIPITNIAKASDLTAEIAARIAGDVALQTAITNVVTLLNAEVGDRIAGDSAAISSANSYSDALIAGIKASVPTQGDNLNKLYNLIVASFQEVTVANTAARDAYNAVLGMHIFVTDDGDGKWALYKATTAGVGATYIKLSDPDLLNTAMTASQIKAAYESNANTNALTDALLAKLNAIIGTNTGDETVSSLGTLIHTATNKATPVDADEVGIWDSVTGLLQRLSWANIKAALSGVFLSKANNLSDIADTGTSRLNLKVPILFSARVEATGNVASLSGAGTYNGVALVAGNRILLPAQTNGIQNGPWIVQAGAWVRPTDWATGATVSAHAIVVMSGPNAGSIWTMRNSVPIVIDTDVQTWGNTGVTLSFPGTGTRVLEAATGGAVTAVKTIIDQIITDSTLIAHLQTSGNWKGTPSYDDTSALSVTGFQGQMYFGQIGAIPYWFFCRQDGFWIRESLTDLKLPTEGGTGIGAAILATASAMVRINAAGTAFENSGLLFNQNLRTSDSPTFVSFTMAGNLTIGMGSVTSISANQNNYNGLSTNNAFRLTSTAAFNITGLAGGAAGRVYILINVGTFNLTLTNDDTASTAGNRFNFASGGNTVLPPLGAIGLIYDGVTSRWRDIFFNGAATHLVGATTVPAIAAGSGAGSSPTVAIVGNDISGKITVTTGTLPTAAATVVTITFSVPYTAAPKVILSPHNALSAALTGASMVFAAGETTAIFTITAGTAGLVAATTYEWNYHAIQ